MHEYTSIDSETFKDAEKDFRNNTVAQIREELIESTSRVSLS
jgi:hypothetical protein